MSSGRGPESSRLDARAQQCMDLASSVRDLGAHDLAAHDLPGALSQLRAATRRTLLLDYDGTLVPIVAAPELAVPDPPLLDLLARLQRAHATEVHVVTGRGRESIEPWLGRLPIHLHAEHGYWSRTPLGDWSRCGINPPACLERGVAILREHAVRAPGARLEQKTASAAFHYRHVAQQLAVEIVQALREQLSRELGEEVDLLDGHKVLELRTPGVHKGVIARRVVSAAPSTSVFFAAGDDRTDEDLFAALPAAALTVHVGVGSTRALLRLSSPYELRQLLQQLTD